MPESFADAGRDYLAQLLDAAVRAPAAASEPASGRIAADLLVALASKGEDDRVEPYLSWGPGRQTVYEVRCYDEAEQLVGRQRYAGAGEAIRATGGCCARAGYTARVVAIADDDEERWMMAVRESAAIYRIPDPTQKPDPQPESSAVVAELRQLLAGMTVHVDATEIEQVVHRAMAGSSQAQVVGDARTGTADADTIEELVREVVSQIRSLLPSAEDIAEKVTRQISAGAPAPAAAAPSHRDQQSSVARPRPTLPPPRVVPARTQLES